MATEGPEHSLWQPTISSPGRHGGRVHILSVGLAVFQILVSSSSQHCYGCTFPSKWRVPSVREEERKRERGRGGERERGRGTRKVGRGVERKTQSGAEWAGGRLRGWTAERGSGRVGRSRRGRGGGLGGAGVGLGGGRRKHAEGRRRKSM